MKFLIVSDIHGAHEQLALLSRREERPDAVLMCGDITHFGDADKALPVIEGLKSISPQLTATHGNCDQQSVVDLLAEQGLGEDGKPGRIGEIPVLTIGGSLEAPIFTPSTWTEAEAEELLGKADMAFSGQPWIFICHQPPYESEADRLNSGKNVGSRVIADFIRRTAPALVCTGHIHEAFSVSDFGSSLVINPGSLKEGRYATAIFNSDGVRGELHRL